MALPGTTDLHGTGAEFILSTGDLHNGDLGDAFMELLAHVRGVPTELVTPELLRGERLVVEPTDQPGL